MSLMWENVRSFVCVEVLRPSQPNGAMSSAFLLDRLSPLSG